MKEVTPKKVVSRIRNQKKKQIYILEFKLLTTSATITYKGKVRNVLKLTQVYSYKTDETVYVSPKKPIGISVI